MLSSDLKIKALKAVVRNVQIFTAIYKGLPVYLYKRPLSPPLLLLLKTKLPYFLIQVHGVIQAGQTSLIAVTWSKQNAKRIKQHKAMLSSCEFLLKYESFLKQLKIKMTSVPSLNDFAMRGKEVKLNWLTFDYAQFQQPSPSNVWTLIQECKILQPQFSDWESFALVESVDLLLDTLIKSKQETSIKDQIKFNISKLVFKPRLISMKTSRSPSRPILVNTHRPQFNTFTHKPLKRSNSNQHLMRTKSQQSSSSKSSLAHKILSKRDQIKQEIIPPNKTQSSFQTVNDNIKLQEIELDLNPDQFSYSVKKNSQAIERLQNILSNLNQQVQTRPKLNFHNAVRLNLVSQVKHFKNQSTDIDPPVPIKKSQSSQQLTIQQPYKLKLRSLNRNQSKKQSAQHISKAALESIQSVPKSILETQSAVEQHLAVINIIGEAVSLSHNMLKKKMSWSFSFYMLYKEFVIRRQRFTQSLNYKQNFLNIKGFLQFSQDSRGKQLYSQLQKELRVIQNTLDKLSQKARQAPKLDQYSSSQAKVLERILKADNNLKQNAFLYCQTQKLLTQYRELDSKDQKLLQRIKLVDGLRIALATPQLKVNHNQHTEACQAKSKAYLNKQQETLRGFCDKLFYQ